MDGVQHLMRAPWQGRTTSREQLNDSTYRSRAIRSCRYATICWRRSFADNTQPAIGKLGLRTGNLVIRSSRYLILLL